MSFYRSDDKHQVRSATKKVSTAIALGSLLAVDTNGFAIPATSTTTNFLGVAMQPVTAADADYALATEIIVDRPRPGDRFMANCSIVPTQTMVGVNFDLVDANTVDLAASTIGIVRVVGIVPGAAAASSLVVVEFTPQAEFFTPAP